MMPPIVIHLPTLIKEMEIISHRHAQSLISQESLNSVKWAISHHRYDKEKSDSNYENLRYSKYFHLAAPLLERYPKCVSECVQKGRQRSSVDINIELKD